VYRSTDELTVFRQRANRRVVLHELHGLLLGGSPFVRQAFDYLVAVTLTPPGNFAGLFNLFAFVLATQAKQSQATGHYFSA
jgi:hypothetical protein